MPRHVVSSPVTKKTIFQGSMIVPYLRHPTAMPYATQPPKICAKPLKLNQMAVREPCSFLVYHCEVKRAKPGVTAASKTPRKKRMAIAPA